MDRPDPDVPTYNGLVPRFRSEELRDRLRALPFHIATLLHPSNLTLAADLGRSTNWLAYVNRRPASRRTMLKEVLLYLGVTPRVAQCFERVSRSRYLPRSLEPVAYVLEGYQIRQGVHTTCPLLLALVLQSVSPNHEGLAIGGLGSGYGTALAAALHPDHPIQVFETSAPSNLLISRYEFDENVSLRKTSLWDGKLAETPTIVTFRTTRTQVDKHLATAPSWIAPVEVSDSPNPALLTHRGWVLAETRFVHDSDQSSSDSEDE